MCMGEIYDFNISRASNNVSYVTGVLNLDSLYAYESLLQPRDQGYSERHGQKERVIWPQDHETLPHPNKLKTR